MYSRKIIGKTKEEIVGRYTGNFIFEKDDSLFISIKQTLIITRKYTLCVEFDTNGKADTVYMKYRRLKIFNDL